MEIIIDSENVIIRLSGETEYRITYKSLADVEKAIEIIRNLQESAHVEWGTIKVTEIY